MSKKWVLLVEDDEDVQEIMSHDLQTHFNGAVKIITARDGVEATQKLTFQAFDCIVTDLNMPKRDGMHFIEKVKSNPINSSTPLIVVTGYPDPALQKEHPGMPMLEKPYDKSDLNDVLTKQLSLGRLDQRVGAEVLNLLIQSCEHFLVQILKEEPTHLTPSAKKNGEDLKGEIIGCMNIKTKDGICRMGLGFDHDIAKKMLEAVGTKANVSEEQIVNIALSSIFKLTSQLFVFNTGESPSLEKKLVFTDKKSFEYSEVKNARGVIIPIKCSVGTVFAQALYVKPVSKVIKAS